MASVTLIIWPISWCRKLCTQGLKRITEQELDYKVGRRERDDEMIDFVSTGLENIFRPAHNLQATSWNADSASVSNSSFRKMIHFSLQIPIFLPSSKTDFGLQIPRLDYLKTFWGFYFHPESPSWSLAEIRNRSWNNLLQTKCNATR
jgi:hypothetical protein